MIFFQVLLKKGNVREFFIVFAGLAVKFNKTFILGQLLEFFFGLLSSIENIRVELIRENFLRELSEIFEQIGDNNLLGFSLK